MNKQRMNIMSIWTLLFARFFIDSHLKANLEHIVFCGEPSTGIMYETGVVKLSSERAHYVHDPRDTVLHIVTLRCIFKANTVERLLNGLE